jgi:hypothetical protein
MEGQILPLIAGALIANDANTEALTSTTIRRMQSHD